MCWEPCLALLVPVTFRCYFAREINVFGSGWDTRVSAYFLKVRGLSEEGSMEKEYVHLYSTIIAGLVSALNLKKK